MGSMNKVILIGHLGRDPEVRYMPDGTPMARFSLATSESYKDKEGALKEVTDWTKVEVFGKRALVCATYLKKGMQHCVEGKLKTRRYKDREGVERSITVVRMTNMEFIGNFNGKREALQADATRAAAEDAAAEIAAPADAPLELAEMSEEDLAAAGF